MTDFRIPFRKVFFKTLILIIIAVFIYSDIVNYDFINFDDPVYVTDNPAVKNGINYESIIWAFSIHNDICMYWQPVAWLSHMLDAELFGLNPGNHHFSSLILHLFNVILLFILLNKATGSSLKSFVAAAIFAAHPVNVDPVTWIAERKTILSGFFWLSGFLAYYYYTLEPSLKKYSAVLFLFSLGMLTKPVMATFPCALLLFDIWPLKRLEFNKKNFSFKIITEKLPFLIIFGLWFTTPFLSTTLLANETTTETVSVGLRLSNAIVSYSKYVFKFFLPFNLSIHYPYPQSIPLYKTAASLLFLAAVTILFIKQFQKKPWLIIGWLWFAGVLFPSSGLILGTLWPEMADRWAYLPFIGLCIITSWTLFDKRIIISKASKYFIILISSLCITGFAFIAKKQTTHWKNSISVFTHALSVVGYNSLFHQNISAELVKQGKFKEALEHQKIIIDKEPENTEAIYNTGLIYSLLEMPEKALCFFNKTIEKKPDHVNAHSAKAEVLVKSMRYNDAVNTYKKAFKVSEKIPSQMYYNLSFILKRIEKYEEAELYLIKLLKKKKNHFSANILLGEIKLKKKQYLSARRYFSAAAKIDPLSAIAWNGIGISYTGTGEPDKAIAFFKKAIAVNPLMAETRLNLQKALAEKHNKQSIVSPF